MFKNIVLCSDGTGNSDIKNRGSNVFKLYEAVDIQGYKHDPAIPVQVAFYDDGVGTEKLLPLKILGGAFGWGLADNVCDLYTELVHVYEPGDRIFLFGFSRGAYTVRMLSGLIQYCGIIDRQLQEFRDEGALKRQVKINWKAFRGAFERFQFDSERRGAEREKLEAEKRRAQETAVQRRRKLLAIEDAEHAPEGAVKIHFIGVWDTVDAVGVPFDWLRDLINFLIYPIRFPNLRPGAFVERACHALAIDDERRTFWPELWDEIDAQPGRIEQVWFPGVHSNVGGGYAKQGMSLVALDWMMAEAEKCGLHFIPQARNFARQQQDVHDKLYDSRSGAGLYYRWAPRDLVRLCARHNIRKPRIHVSVFERIAQASSGYAPGNLPFELEVIGTSTPNRQGTPWPKPGAFQGIENQVRAAASSRLNRESSLLDGSTWLIGLGRLSYYLFLAATGFAVLLLLCSTQTTRLIGFVLGDWFIKAMDLARSWVGGEACQNVPVWGSIIMVVVSGGLAWLLAQFVDRQIERKYSMFWHGLRANLRKLLHA